MSQKGNITGNTVIPHHKYINPATDFGFKRIFKDEEITRGFLNALLKKYDPKTHIKSVTITDGELDENTDADIQKDERIRLQKRHRQMDI
ncbi:MAG: hypothetical protein J6T70_06255 [Bacteroidales bacterium]|nr:hypothetical protein [Bacteroidales bacterium]